MTQSYTVLVSELKEDCFTIRPYTEYQGIYKNKGKMFENFL